MTKKELLQRIEQLERRVRDLEARPSHVPVPVYVPAQPAWPNLLPIVTCDSVNVGTVAGGIQFSPTIDSCELSGAGAIGWN